MIVGNTKYICTCSYLAGRDTVTKGECITVDYMSYGCTSHVVTDKGIIIPLDVFKETFIKLRGQE